MLMNSPLPSAWTQPQFRGQQQKPAKFAILAFRPHPKRRHAGNR
jgi:hypothetical protein